MAETTLIHRPSRGREEVPVELSRLLHAHEIVLKPAQHDLLVSDVNRTNELQVWHIAEHVVDLPGTHDLIHPPKAGVDRV